MIKNDSLAVEEQPKREFDLLLHESAELQENLRGNSDAMIKIAVFAMPLISAAYIYALSEGKPTDRELLSGVVAVVASLIVLAINGIWSHNMMFIEYKYSVVVPRLYALCGKQSESFGEFISKRKIVSFLVSFWLCQLAFLVVISAFVLILARQGPYNIVSYTVFLAAIFATASSIGTAFYSFRAIRNARSPVVSKTRSYSCGQRTEADENEKERSES